MRFFEFPNGLDSRIYLIDLKSGHVFIDLLYQIFIYYV